MLAVEPSGLKAKKGLEAQASPTNGKCGESDELVARHGHQYLPENPIPRMGGALVAVPGRNTPLAPFDRVVPHIATLGTVLNHHSLGYAYDTDSIAAEGKILAGPRKVKIDECGGPRPIIDAEK